MNERMGHLATAASRSASSIRDYVDVNGPMPPAPMAERQLPLQVRRLEGEITELGAIVSSLVDRLKPLRGDSLTNKGCPENGPSPNLCEVAHAVFVQSDRIRDIRLALDRLLSELEV